MKKTKLIFSTAMLMIAFSIPVFAGDQGTPALTAPGDQHGPARRVSGELSSQAWSGILLALKLIF